MRNVKTALIRFSLAASMLLLAYVCAFSVNQWRAESYFPIQRNFTRQAENALPEEKYRAIKRSLSLAPGRAQYHVVMGKHIVYETPSGTPSDREALLKEAVAGYKRALLLNPSFTDALSYLAWAEFSLGRPFKALHRLETATRYDPNNYFNHLLYGICVSRFLNVIPEYLREIYIARAEESFTRGLSLHPAMARQPMVFSARAELYLGRGDLDSAIAQLQHVRKIDSSTLPHHLRLAGLYMRTGKQNAALHRYNVLLSNTGPASEDRKTVTARMLKDAAAYPEANGLKLLLGNALIEENDWARAVEVIKGLVNAGYWPARTHYMLGQAYEGLGDKKAAYKEYVATLRYRRDHPGASRKVLELYREGAAK